MLRITDGVRTTSLALMITILLMGCFHSPPPKPETRVPGDYSYTNEYIRWFVHQQMKKHDVTGLSLALVDDQRIVWAEGFGYADKAHNVPATPETLYRAGSITKLFTATAIMQLVERGLIDLDQPLTTYLPEFSVKTRFPDSSPITMRHILTHHSGLPRDMLRGMWSSTPQPFATVLDDLTTSYVLHPPNYIFSYSNLGMTVLGHVIERMSGMPYATYVSRKIFEPVGMTTASIETGVAASPLMAHAYNKGKEEPELPLREIPAGGLNASVVDLARFVQMVIAQGRAGDQQVVKPETLKLMLTQQNQDVPLDLDLKMGLGWGLSGVPELKVDGTVASHGGATFHYNGHLVTLPDHKLGAVVMSNSSTGREIVGKIAAALLTSAIEVKSGIPSKEAAPAETLVIPFSPEQLAGFEGWYNTPAGMTKVTRSGGHLRTEVLEKTFRLVPRPNQELGLEYKMLGLFPIDLGGLGQMTFSRAAMAGRDLLIGRMTQYQASRMVVGERIHPVPIPSSWRQRVGSYDIIDLDKEDAIVFQLRLSVQDDFLVMTTHYTKPAPMKLSLALEPPSDTDAIVMGLGHSAGETVEVRQEAGEEILHYSGYRLRRTSTE